MTATSLLLFVVFLILNMLKYCYKKYLYLTVKLIKFNDKPYLPTTIILESSKEKIFILFFESSFKVLSMQNRKKINIKHSLKAENVLTH